jgi:hypothetical protein
LEQTLREFGYQRKSESYRYNKSELKLENRKRSPSAIGIPLNCLGVVKIRITRTTMGKPKP